MTRSLAVLLLPLSAFLLLATPPRLASAQDLPVLPFLNEVVRLPDGRWVAKWGYVNPNPDLVNIDVGENNRFLPAPIDRNQVTNFFSGVYQEVFDVEFPAYSTLVWELDGVRQQASASTLFRGPWYLGTGDASLFSIRPADPEYIPSAPSVFKITDAVVEDNLVLDGGSVGIGTSAIEATLNIEAATPTVLVENTTTGTNALALDANGNLTLSGVLTEASSLHRKTDRRPVDGEAVLAKVATLPVETWRYRTDDASVRHMGPMAQHFYAAFGLGVDEEHLAPLDANGVALASVKALLARVETLETGNEGLRDQVETLKTENEALRDRLTRLEHLVRHHLGAETDSETLE